MPSKQTELVRIAELRRLYQNGDAQRIRAAAGITQADIARTVGVSRSLVCQWESGDRRPQGESALRGWSLIKSLEEAIKA